MCEWPKVYKENHPKSRKEYICCACSFTIPKNHIYYNIRGLWDERWETYKMHKECHEFYLDAYYGEVGFIETFEDLSDPYSKEVFEKVKQKYGPKEVL